MYSLEWGPCTWRTLLNRDAEVSTAVDFGDECGGADVAVHATAAAAAKEASSGGKVKWLGQGWAALLPPLLFLRGELASNRKVTEDSVLLRGTSHRSFAISRLFVITIKDSENLDT